MAKRMQDRGYVTPEARHGTLWARGLELAAAEIGRDAAPAGRWAGKTVPAGSAGAAGPGEAAPAAWPGGDWARETAPADRRMETAGRETWAAQAV